MEARGLETDRTKPQMTGVVLHCDANAFFAACHVAEDPSLEGRPLVVAGDPRTRHGVVLTASYPARARGVRTAMTLAAARRLCPDLVVIPPDRGLYLRYSARLRTLLASLSPLVEPFSVDEAWVDMTGALAPWDGDPVAAARALRGRVREELRLRVSVGVSRNKLLAKQASEMQKPDGLTVLWPEDVPARLWPRPVGELFGCGPRTAEKLRALGVATIGDLARYPPAPLARRLGSLAATLQARARGEDDEPVRPPRAGDVRSLSAETTLTADVASPSEAEPALLALADEVAERLRAHGLAGRTVTLKFRTAAFRTHTRQLTLDAPTCYTEPIYEAARRLFAARGPGEPVRLLGVGVSGLSPRQAQLDLWGEGRQARLADAMDRIRARFGHAAILPARLARGDGLARGGSTFEKPWRRPGEG
jgi:DNA polymerase-4